MRLLLLVMLFAASVQAQVPAHVGLGAPWRDGEGAWWVPIEFTPNDEDSVTGFKVGDGFFRGNIRMTGTLSAVVDPENLNGFFYTAPGDFWLTPPYASFTMQPDIPFSPVRYIATGAGYFAVPGQPGYCGPGPTGKHTLFSFKTQGSGTVFFIHENVLLAVGCNPYDYAQRTVDVTPVQVPPEIPVGVKRRSTWGETKAIYR